jgi:DUF971 family protein
MKPFPTELKLLNPEELQITWSDGVQHVLTVRQLRAHCPCASCREQRKGNEAESPLLPVLRLEEAQPLRFVSMRPVGNYAYSVCFSDGHDTGIFPLELLRELGEAVQ